MRTIWQANARDSAVSDIVSRLSDRPVPFGRMSYEHINESPGLYCFWVRGACLYVGMSMNLRRRLREHCEAEDNVQLAEYFETYGSEIGVVTVYHDAPEARLRELESEAIRRMRPLANRQGTS